MKRILRSVINFSGADNQTVELRKNIEILQRSRIEWLHPEDEKIFQLVISHFSSYQDAPSILTIRDYFDRSGDTGVLERLKDIEAADSYYLGDFENLLQSQTDLQNQAKLAVIANETKEIAQKGLIMGKGRNKKSLKGVRDAFLHFSQSVGELMVTQGTSVIGGDIRQDADVMWDEYQQAKIDKTKAYGKLMGIEHIDSVCRGCKRGELWIHAAAPGELKCLPGDASLYDHKTYRRRTLKEMYTCGSLPTVTALFKEGSEMRLVKAESSHLVQNGEREVFDLTLESGRSIGATSNHRFFTQSGWKELSELTTSDLVAVPAKVVNEDRTPYTLDEVKVMGYILGDARITSRAIFYAPNPLVRADFSQCLRNLGLIESYESEVEIASFQIKTPNRRIPYVLIDHGVGDRWGRELSPVRHLLEKTNMGSHSLDRIRVPSEFFGMSSDYIAAFIGAIWSSGRTISAKDLTRQERTSLGHNGTITYTTTSHNLSLDIQSMLLRLGIRSTIKEVSYSYGGVATSFWTVIVATIESKRKFCEKIKVIGKEDMFARTLRDLPPEGPVEDEEIIWDRVERIISRGVEMTYDLSVPEHHTFVANEIITHNTTFALNWVYNLVTHYRTNVFYASLEMPYSQLRRILYVIHSSHPKWLDQGFKPLDYQKVRDGELSSSEEKFYKAVVDDFGNNPEHCRLELWSPDSDVTVDDIRLKAELLQREMDVGFVALDHGGLITPKNWDKDFTIRSNAVIRDSKKFALHFNGGMGVPTLMLFQINRQGKADAEKNNGKYTMRALSYANECEKSADYLTTTYLDDDLRKNGRTKVSILKSRDTALFETTELRIDFKCRRISNWDPSLECSDGMGVDGVDDLGNQLLGTV